VHNRRILVLFCVIAAAFFAVEIWLFSLQVVRGDYYAEYADRQRLALMPLDVARARILTSDGAVLAEDRLAFDVAVVIGKLDPSKERRIRGPLRSLFYVPRREKLLGISEARWQVREETRDGKARVLVKAWSKLDVELPDARSRPMLDVVERQSEFALPEHLVRSVTRLAQLSGSPSDELLASVIQTAVDVARLRTPVFAAVPILKGVDYDIVAAVETRPEEFRGFQIETRFERAAPSGPLAPHLVGYLSKFDRRDMDRATTKYRGWPPSGYFMKLRAGRAGVEKSMDEVLRGEFGMECVEHDHLNRRQRVLADAPATPGRDVVLTIDSRLQKRVEKELEGSVGAAVFLDVKTGHVLAIASSPKYDPARFRQDYAELSRDPGRPLVNRALAAMFPLGSVFKIATALAALEKGSVPASVNCTGFIRLGRRTFHCHRTYGHGTLGLTDAIKYSCNVFFYRTAQRTGDAALIEMARRLGLGSKTGVSVPGEAGHDRHFPRAARGGELLNLAIGQGRLVVTPLQVAQMVAAVANDGVLAPPRVVRELRPFDTDSIAAEVLPDPRRPRSLGISKRAIDAVRLGLYKVVNEYGGTGNRAFQNFTRPFKVCGKTSTAQRGTGQPNVGWFAGYAPHDKPRVAFAIAIDGLTARQGGGSTAAPVARKIFDAMPLDLLGLEQAKQDPK